MKEDDMRHRQDLERKRLPKIQRNEMRTLVQAKRKQFRSERSKRESIVGGMNAAEKEKMREVRIVHWQQLKLIQVFKDISEKKSHPLFYYWKYKFFRAHE